MRRAVAWSVFGLILATTATAEPILFSGTDSSGRAASVSFDLSGTTLTVVLTNTSSVDVLVPIDVLTAVFFDAAGTLSPLSAQLGGSSVLFGSANGGNVGGEWAFQSGLASPGLGPFGISSVGLGLFGPGDRFDATSNLQGPDSPNGLQYGITSAGDDSSTGNTPVTGTNALIQNSVTFTFSAPSFSLESIENVVFQYGTSLTEPRVPGGGGSVPEPGSLVTVGLGLVAVAYFRRRR